MKSAPDILYFQSKAEQPYWHHPSPNGRLTQMLGPRIKIYPKDIQKKQYIINNSFTDKFRRYFLKHVLEKITIIDYCVTPPIRKYGYEVVDAPNGRRGSVGSGNGSRRGSMSMDENRTGSISPYRATTPEARRESLNRYSPDSSYSSSGSVGRRGSNLAPPPEPRRSSISPLMRRAPPGKSPLASPRNSRLEPFLVGKFANLTF